MGVEASLAGLLVFSTLHTNSAPESITPLLDMGMNPFILRTRCWESWRSA
jgi:type II secretory ATPase GspE/PulE/Tfp pilus assembly ATPase PilB-like protein